MLAYSPALQKVPAGVRGFRFQIYSVAVAPFLSRKRKCHLYPLYKYQVGVGFGNSFSPVEHLLSYMTACEGGKDNNPGSPERKSVVLSGL